MNNIEDIARRKRDAKPPQKSKPPPAFTVVDIRNFGIAEIPKQRYVIESLFPTRNVTLFGSHGGAGKSILIETLCAHLSCGKAWAGLEVEQGRAVFVSLEDEAVTVKRRLAKIAECYRLDFAMIEKNLLILDGTQGDGVLGAVVESYGSKSFTPTAALEELREHAIGARLIVVDNASDAYDGNENERRQVRAFMRALAQLARDNDAAVVLLAHIDKQAARHGANGNTYSGSTAWHNSARSRIALVEVDGGVELRHEKHQFGKLAEPIRLVWDAEGVLVPGGEVVEELTERDKADDASVLAALKAAAEQGTNVPTARTGPATAQNVLSTFRELPESLIKTDGRRRFWSSIDRLVSTKRVGSESYLDRHRNKKSRFLVVDKHGVREFVGSPTPPVELTHAGCASSLDSRQFRTNAEPPQTSASGEASL